MKKLLRKARSRTGKPDRVSAHEDRRRPRFSREISVLYEDDAVVVLDKPAGLLAVPIKGSDTPSALSLLVAKLKLKRQRALVVHRIDRFASGALLFAKTGPDRDALVQQFLEHTPVRQYLAVLRGRLGVEAGTLVHYFRRVGMFQQLRTARDPQGARAELRYSAKGSQPYGKAGSGFGPRRPSPASFLPGAFRAVGRRCRGRSRQTGRTSGCAD